MPNDCSAVLRPDKETITLNKTVRYSYLKLINQDNYAESKTSLSAAVEGIPGLEELGGSADYNAFEQRRAQLFQRENVNYTDEFALAIVRETVSEGARKAFVDCITGRTGLQVYFTDDKLEAATAHVHYRGVANTTVTVSLQLTGGRALSQEVISDRTIPHDGTYAFIVTREGRADIRLAGND